MTYEAPLADAHARYFLKNTNLTNLTNDDLEETPSVFIISRMTTERKYHHCIIGYALPSFGRWVYARHYLPVVSGATPSLVRFQTPEAFLISAFDRLPPVGRWVYDKSREIRVLKKYSA